MINKKYFKKIAMVAVAAALLFQVRPAIAADAFDEEADAVTEVQTHKLDTEEGAETEAPETTDDEEVTADESTPTEVVPIEIQPVEIAPIEIAPLNIDIPDTEETEAEESQPEEITPEKEEDAEEELQPEESTLEQKETTEEQAEEENIENTEVTDPEEVQQETPDYRTDFQFENDEVRITATATEEAKLPQNTEMKAVKLEEGTTAYEEAKTASAEKLGTGEDADYCFYDVTFMADGQELFPEKGTVTIHMEFKNIQVDAEAQTQNVVHIEDTEEGRQIEDVTSGTQDGSNLQSVDFAM